METESIKAELIRLHQAEKKIFVTSSFQTHSIPLLHLIWSARVPVDVLFLQTRFHFPETLAFRNLIIDRFGLNLINLESVIPLHMQRDMAGRFLYVTNPNRCCEFNKTQPMRPVLASYDIWVNGVRRDQSSTRAAFERYQESGERAVRFHPMLDWTARDIWMYRKEHDLPAHPLEEENYQSIGCAPCTRKWDLDGRGGRWFGMEKTECGLHTQLIVGGEE